MKKIRNALLNILWGAGYFALGNKVLGIGLLVTLPFLHWPVLIGNWALYLTYPFNLVPIGHIILTITFVVDAYTRTPNQSYDQEEE
ncbi:MAG: hypothetical protein ACXACG_03330 [Candidatus Thorarchaeota archaeon]|jgi:hypothetical protein